MAFCAVLFGSSADEVGLSFFAVVLPYSVTYLLSRLSHVGRSLCLPSLVGLVATGVALLWGLGDSAYGVGLLEVAWLALGYSFLGAFVASIVRRRRARPRG